MPPLTSHHNAAHPHHYSASDIILCLYDPQVANSKVRLLDEFSYDVLENTCSVAFNRGGGIPDIAKAAILYKLLGNCSDIHVERLTILYNDIIRIRDGLTYPVNAIVFANS